MKSLEGIAKGHAVYRARLDAEFFARTDRSSGCWEWTGPRQTPSRTGRTGGYGRIKRHGRQVFAHRHAYELAKGSIPDGLVVMHTCDNPPCINPDHLMLGTKRDNSRDMVRKGRWSMGARP